MTLYLVRHADAKSRGGWDQPDALRPLTKKGRRQSEGLIDLVGKAPIRRVLSSPALRCVDTVVPLARHLGIEVTPMPALAEGSDSAGACELAKSMVGKHGDSVLCAHGDLVPEILRGLARAGARYGEPLRWPKGSIWVLTDNGKRVVSGSLLEPATD